MLLIHFLLLASTCLSFNFFNKESVSQISFVDSESGQILDEYKRSRIFHGVNVVFKEFPYYPNLDTFHPRWSFSKEDVDILADLGLNAIRLDVSWAGAEPIRGAYNETFFQQIHRIVDMCEKRGIYVLLEFHQDLFSERYCGNGAPIWASRPLNPKSNFGFPFPAKKPFKIDNHTFIANKEDCKLFSDFATGYFNYGLSQAFDDLYKNKGGLLDSFAEYWRKVATEFRDKKNVLGYELINEPWVGQFYSSMTLALGIIADKKRLQPMNDVLFEAIRSADSNKLIFFESVNINFKKIGFTKVPGGKAAANKSVLAWHYYWNPVSKDTYFKTRWSEARRIGAGSFATEIDISWDGTLRKNLEIDEGGKQINDTLDSMKRLDDLKISWLGWEYKTYVRKTGWGDGLFDEATGKIRPQMAKLYSRPYARAVNGIITKMEYVDETGYFILHWTVPPNTSADILTEVSLNRQWHYPKGYDVLITPTSVNTHWTKENILYISVISKPMEQKLRMTIKPTSEIY